MVYLPTLHIGSTFTLRLVYGLSDVIFCKMWEDKTHINEHEGGGHTTYPLLNTSLALYIVTLFIVVSKTIEVTKHFKIRSVVNFSYIYIKKKKSVL